VRTVPDELGLPLIVKPPREGSTMGVTKVMGYSQMQAPCARPATTPMCCARKFIEGDEVTCPVLGTGASARRCR
jgi:D-alanine-D-alanine ligase